VAEGRHTAVGLGNSLSSRQEKPNQGPAARSPLNKF
jgi:hypothetical protein